MKIRIINTSLGPQHLAGIYQTFLEPGETILVDRFPANIEAARNLKQLYLDGDISLVVVADLLDEVLTFSSGQLVSRDVVGPLPSDDLSKGYGVGSRWFDTLADTEFVCLDASTGAAVWIPTTGSGGPPSGAAGGDLSGVYPNPSVAALTETGGPTQLVTGAVPDNALLQRVGATLVGGPLWFGARATDPPGPQSAGDSYFNTALGQRMSYDAVRAKWLSDAGVNFQFGRNGNTAAGSFYRTINGLVTSAVTGIVMPFAGTVTSLGYTRTDVDLANFEVVANGVTLGTLASSALSGFSGSLDADFVAGDILTIRNSAGGNTTSNVSVWFGGKWRV